MKSMNELLLRIGGMGDRKERNTQLLTATKKIKTFLVKIGPMPNIMKTKAGVERNLIRSSWIFYVPRVPRISS